MIKVLNLLVEEGQESNLRLLFIMANGNYKCCSTVELSFHVVTTIRLPTEQPHTKLKTKKIVCKMKIAYPYFQLR